jgi:uncharacterized membrane protein YbhN (UPF0104 family)
VTLGLFAVLARVVEPAALFERLRGVDPRWIFGAFALAVAQVVASAWRWRFTVTRLGLSLPLPQAVAEYYLATFLNQVLPGGVMGDVSRAWRHARAGAAARAVHGVLIERVSGQLVMVFVALLSALVLVRDPWLRGGVVLVLALATLVVAGLRRRVGRRPESPVPESSGPDSPVPEPSAASDPADPATPRFADSLDRALFAPGAFSLQIASSTWIVATYLATGVLAARALGLTTPLALLVPLIATLLLSMLLPVTVAGWGLREAVAAALWPATGLGSADGVALSVTYGVFVLLGSLPGAVVLLVRRRRPEPAGRSRTPDHRPAQSAAPRAASPDQASRPPEG